jgi:hypothetical protein
MAMKCELRQREMGFGADYIEKKEVALGFWKWIG